MAEQAKRDQNFVTSMLFVGTDGGTYNVHGDELTGRLYVDVAGGSGTVTSVSVVSANGFAGTVATATTTPAITLSTTVNSPVLAGNGTAISAATTTGSGSTVVLNNSPTFVDDITVGTAATATGSILFKGLTSGTVTLSVADAAGTWTLKLPTTDGDNLQFLQTDGAGNTTWAAPAGGGNVSNTGTPANNQVAIWTDATTIEGVAGLTFDGTTLTTTALTVDNITVDLNTISSTSGNLNITPVAGSAIVLDATISIDAGVVTGITSLGVTGTRVTAGFFVDLTVTNAIAGSITGTAAVATTVTVADEAADTSCFVNFTTAATGNLGVKTNAGLTFNSSTGALTATSFVGSITGNAATVTFANEATDTSCFIAFGTAATGSLPVNTNVNMTFDSSTGIATFASTVLTTTDINGGTIDGVTIGGTSAGNITGLVITANTSFMPDANDGAVLGASGTAFSDLFLASGAVINFLAGDVTVTHSAGILTVAGSGAGDLRVTTAGTNTASVVTVGGTQTLTSKTLTSPTITTATLSGAQQLAENASITLDQTLSADGTYSGITIAGTAGATLAFGQLVYLAVADSRWELCDADTAALGYGVLIGMCVLAAAGDGSATTILLQGNIRADAQFPALTVGAAAYMGETAGAIQVAIPTGADNTVRVVGFALTADSLYFNPSSDSSSTVA